jgi:hypothetical protein
MKIAALVLCAVAATSAPGNARTTVQHAFAAVLAAGGFHGQAQGSVFGTGAPPLSGEVEVVLPDRIHVRSDALEFIAVGDDAWINAFGVWAPTDRALLPVTAFDVAEMRKAIASIRVVHADGTAQAGRCGAHVFSFESSGQLPGAAANGRMRAWICDDSGRLARVEATDSSGHRLVFDFDWTRRADVRAPY